MWTHTRSVDTMRRAADVKSEGDDPIIFKNYDKAIAEYREKVHALFKKPADGEGHRPDVQN
jgi:hypothetical protein